jgi:hypothetical protein
MPTAQSGSGLRRITVAFAALHRTLFYQGEDTGLYVVASEDGAMFFSRSQPPLYDDLATPIAMHEVLPGACINIRFRIEDGINKVEAVQIVNEPKPQCPFEPVSEVAVVRG